MSINAPKTETVTPNPVDFIMSISEQGYRLETALADLIDNSISAGADKIEVILDVSKSPFQLFIADNGGGMDEETLKAAMRFPSSSMNGVRESNDLGRFGLGLKTASFSQTRHFTVLSRNSESERYQGRTWDVELLKQKGWVLKVESAQEITKLLGEYKSTSQSLLAEFDETFHARTIVAWRGLYKFESHIAERDCADVLKTELTEKTRGHLSLVFHRFMERKEKPLQIRLNNVLVKPFNPFPSESGVRHLSEKHRRLGDDGIKIAGFILPTSSIDDVKQGRSPWAPKGKGLMDLEGIYIYRADRIILFGSWLGMTPRSSRMQLGRMRVEFGNGADHLLQLNIAKSQVEMPHDIKDGFKESIAELKTEAEREYYNRTVRAFDSGRKPGTEPFIRTHATNRGAQMTLNAGFPLITELNRSLDSGQKTMLKTVIRMVSTELNKIRRVHADTVFNEVVQDGGLTKAELLELVNKLLDGGLPKDFVKTHVVTALGYRLDSLPTEVTKLIG